jgi:hypothetical protein
MHVRPRRRSPNYHRSVGQREPSTIFAGRSPINRRSPDKSTKLGENIFTMRFISFFLLACLFSFRQPVATDEASFFCLIDGTPFSSNSTDGMANAAFKTGKDLITFSLVSMDARYKGKVPPQFSFTIAPSGTSHFKSGDANNKYSAKYSPANYSDAYNAESGSATVTSLTANRIQGTFAGVFSGMGKTFKVTEGKFDLPRAKYSPPLL